MVRRAEAGIWEYGKVFGLKRNRLRKIGKTQADKDFIQKARVVSRWNGLVKLYCMGSRCGKVFETKEELQHHQLCPDCHTKKKRNAVDTS